MISIISPSTLISFLCVFAIKINKIHAEFNLEVKGRVTERIQEFLNIPVKNNAIISEYRKNGAFPNGMTGADRDFFLKFTWSLASSFEISNMYVGLEDGVFMGNNEDALYREPGNSGYNASEGFVPEDKVKNLNSCVDEKGVEIPCIMKAGRSYIKCQDDCVLEPCLDEDSQKNCTTLFEQDLEGRVECESKIKWCEKYTIETSKEGQLLGFVPFTGYCANIFGDVTETSGEVRKDFNGAVGDCFFEDGQTKVNRSSLPGDFEYCGGEGELCDDTFLGGYKSIDYDPRWRPWYIDTKKYQQSMWGNPYPNYSDLQMSITYTTPIYSLEGEKNVFKGVLAVDYSLKFISSFLLETYGNSDINVIIFEDADPYYLIASSTGINPTTIALSSDRNIPCPEGQLDDCESFRITALELGKSRVGDGTTKATNEDEISKINSDVNDINEILTTAFILQKDAGFRQDELVVIKSSDHSTGPLAYLSQTHAFEQAGINLKWNVLIVMPMDIASGNAITADTGLFVIVICIGVIGFILCIAMFILLFQRRKDRIVIYGDWRFTSAFICGCAMLNLSTLLLIGPNTNALCLGRMWTFHLFFVFALAPLMVKTWRVYKLVGKEKFRRKTISNLQTLAMTAPFILTQIIILLVFTYIDPPEAMEIIEISLDGTHFQNFLCRHQSRAFMAVQIVFEGGLVLIGCCLAWKTRNLDEKFGEAKQMILAMYNIAFIALVIMLVSTFVSVEEVGKYALQAMGVLWGTVFSSAAFVVPRLLQNSKDRKQGNQPRISGVSVRSGTSSNE